MAIITSWAIGVDTAANKPVAGNTGRVHLETDTLNPAYDNGTSWVPWRAGISIPLFLADSAATARTIIPSATPTYDSWGGANQVTIGVKDFTRFRQARMIIRYIVNSGTIMPRCRDLTNSVNIGNALSLTSVTWATDIGAWTNLNASTTGDIPYELQLTAATAGDNITIGSVFLGLR